MKKSTAKKPTARLENDAALLKAARSAQFEGGSFTEMYRSVTATGGMIELLFHTTNGLDGGGDDVNWCAVADILDDARERLTGVYAALGELERFEREEMSEDDLDSHLQKQTAARAAQRMDAILGSGCALKDPGR